MLPGTEPPPMATALGFLLVGACEVAEGPEGGVFPDDDGGVVADDSGDGGEVAEVLRKDLLQRADDDGGGSHHQGFAALGCGFNQMGDGFSPAAAGHVFVGGVPQQSAFGEGLPGSAGGSVPSPAGPAGNEKVNVFHRLLGPGGRDGRKRQRQRGQRRAKSAPD